MIPQFVLSVHPVVTSLFKVMVVNNFWQRENSNTDGVLVIIIHCSYWGLSENRKNIH
jgi:hypothetical protein